MERMVSPCSVRGGEPMLKAGRWWMWPLPVLLLLALWHWGSAPQTQPQTQPMRCSTQAEACVLSVDGIRVNLTPQPKVLKPFQLTVEAPEAQAVYASFAMPGMEMGLNRYRLLKQADGIWKAEVTLPVCVQGRSDWHMLLELRPHTGAMQSFRLAFAAAK